jgi:transposase InsO family protein
VKLNKRKIRYIINHRKKGESSGTIAVDMKISKRRVEQIWKQYKETGKEPKIGINMGRPTDPFDPIEAEIIIKAYEQYKFGARMLETIIRESYNMHIPHNRIHMHLLSVGLAREEERKKKRRKWVRYEREHSMSAGHIDWHEESKDGIKVCAILDDASRKILAGGEFENINTENTIKVIDQLVERYWLICPLRELIMDHGSEFGAHRLDEKGEWDSEFKQHILKYEIRPILARVNHPQTNGKIEKWFHTYQRFRKDFSSFEEFVDWYNNRPHGSLNFSKLETPEQAFWRKIRPEAVFSIGHRLFGL